MSLYNGGPEDAFFGGTATMVSKPDTLSTNYTLRL
jgi:hypothetical protein